MSAPVPPPSGRSRTKEVAIVATAAVMIVFLFVAPEALFYLIVCGLLLLALAF